MSTHKKCETVQGGGICCNQLAADRRSGRLAPGPVGIGYVTDAITVSTKNGPRCGHCETRFSKSAKHPNRVVVVFKFGGQMCPSAAGGCSAMLG